MGLDMNDFWGGLISPFAFLSSFVRCSGNSKVPSDEYTLIYFLAMMDPSGGYV